MSADLLLNNPLIFLAFIDCFGSVFLLGNVVNFDGSIGCDIGNTTDAWGGINSLGGDDPTGTCVKLLSTSERTNFSSRLAQTESSLPNSSFL